ncbi:hypothetical protein B0J14DRAFT_680303, partial [Halenospora varia]
LLSEAPAVRQVIPSSFLLRTSSIFSFIAGSHLEQQDIPQQIQVTHQSSLQQTKYHFQKHSKYLTRYSMAEYKETVDKMLQGHATEVAQLIVDATEIITLVVGPQMARIPCLKVLLGYYSGFFNGALWLYTATFADWYLDFGPSRVKPRSVTLAELWVMADRLLIPKLTNHLMVVICECCQADGWSIGEVEYIYKNTIPGSMLRLYMKDMIAVEGPLHNRGEYPLEHMEEWMALITEGGDLVTDCALFGFARWVDGEDAKPHYFKNMTKYFQEVDNTKPEEWLAKNYSAELVQPKAAELVLNNTTPESRLRLYLKDVLAMEGPLHDKSSSHASKLCDENYKAGFANWKEDKQLKPYNDKNRDVYFQAVDPISPKLWLEKYCGLKVFPILLFLPAKLQLVGSLPLREQESYLTMTS